MTGVVVVAAAPAVPPTVSITNLPNNKLYAAPGAATVGAVASDSDGTISNVQLLTNGVSAATNTVAPYIFSLSNLTAGYYTLRAKAVDSQALTATSSPVTIRVAAKPTLTFQPGSNGPLRFQFSSATGISYVVEGSVALTNFSPIVTNPGSGSAIQFSQTNPAPDQRFFRLRLE